MRKRQDVVDLLIRQGLVAKAQIEQAMEETKRTGLSLEQALAKLGLVTEETIARAYAAELGVPYMDLSEYLVDQKLTELIPENVARKYKVVPLFKIGDSLTVAMVDPADITVIDQIRRLSRVDTIEPVLATEQGIKRVLDSCYAGAGTIKGIIDSLDKKRIDQAKGKKPLGDIVEEAPIIKLVNMMIMQAVKDRASDIHFEPEENFVRIRYRVDGVLHEIDTAPKTMEKAIISRIKILAKLDIAESRKPQDGQIRLKIEDKDLDIRVSTFPTVNGENVVLRLLDKSSVLFGLAELGLSKQDLQIFDKLIRQPNGIVLVTGPTGSGKTTTLYAVLSTINSMERNIVTIEDPVEYELPLIRQTPINPKAGVTFAEGLRNILRQDPDIIMVGEIRDKETADIAIQAAMTGHLVFSTLHTNDAPSALTRLIDMGVEPFLAASSVVGILAQRLVRTICPSCKEKYAPADETIKDLEIEPSAAFYHGKGCPECKQTGFLGRIGIFELLIINEEIRKMVNEKTSADQIKKKALQLGMRMLREDGIEKIKKGITTPDEVFRVTQEEL